MLLPWTGELREAVVDEYRDLFGQFLAEGEDYDVSCPPEGNLTLRETGKKAQTVRYVTTFQSAVWEWHVEVYLL